MLIKSRISICMPAYNAAAHIEQVIERVPLEVWERLLTAWIVDDGSTDSTGEVLRRIARDRNQVWSVHLEVNRGYGFAVKTGLQRCREDGCSVAVCLHADGQYAPESIPAGLEMLETQGLDILQGSRIASGTALSGGMPRYKFVANRALTFFENIVYGLSMTDYHSGYLFYSRRALDTIPFDKLSTSFDFDVEVIASARARGLKVGEMPIPTRYADEVSHVKSISYGLRCVRVMLNYLRGRYR